jgi:hypothetical protein
METLKDVFDIERVALRDIRAQGGECIEVPLRQDRIASRYLDLLGEHLATYMARFTGRGYSLSRETMSMANTRFVREPGHEAFGLKVFVDGNRILISRVAILEDESILPNYVRHIKLCLVEEAPKPKVSIDLPSDFLSPPAPEPPAEPKSEN